MGTTMAPALALIVVAYYYKEEYLKSLQQQPLLWRRYIDDVLSIWPYSQEDFLQFFQGLNPAHPNLKFMMELLYISVYFSLYQTRLYYKYRRPLQFLQVCTMYSSESSHQIGFIVVIIF